MKSTSAKTKLSSAPQFSILPSKNKTGARIFLVFLTNGFALTKIISLDERIKILYTVL